VSASGGTPEPKVFRFVGSSGVGKTTLLERIVRTLAVRGVRVAVAKDTHHDVELDRPGKDSWRLRQAGAAVVALATDGQLALIERREQRATLGEIVARIGRKADLLLAEGFRDDQEQPAVLVWRAALGQPPPMRGRLVAVVSDDTYPANVPRFSFEQLEELLGLLLDARGAGQSS
jgi:molybdopterin-guanine dinucleotide biosynthesis protein B